MKVMDGKSAKRPEVKHPKEKGGEALRAGMEALRMQQRDERHDKPERPHHRREN